MPPRRRRNGRRSEDTLACDEAVRIMGSREPGDIDRVPAVVSWAYHQIKRLSDGIASCHDLPGQPGRDARSYWSKSKDLFGER